MAKTKRSLLKQILRLLKALAGGDPPVRFLVGPVESRNPTQGTFHMALTMTDIQHTSATIQEKDAAGNPVPADFPTPPTWTSSDPTIVTVSPSADGSNADIATTGKLGNAQVTVEGVTAKGKTIRGIGDITVVTSDATTVEIAFGVPADK